MNSSFISFFELGFDHILNIKALDHLLYIMALTAVFTIKDWKKVLWLITAFTIGHSISLFCSALDVFSLPIAFVEFSIPFTILITAIFNVVQMNKVKHSVFNFPYIMALFFGFIHGMAFAGDIKHMLGSDSIFTAVFGFNIGIELAQFIVVVIILGLGYLLQSKLHLSAKMWNIILSSLAGLYAIKMIIETL